jgi:putative ABC transport system permease protein
VSRGARALFRSRQAEQDLADEVRHYLDAAAEAGMAAGLPPDQAERAARLELGNATAVREQMRGAGWETVFSEWLTDLRHAGRRLRASPVFTLVSVITLALGLGAATAIWSAVRPILFDPLPYPDGKRIVALWDYGTGGTRLDVTFGTFRELEARTRSFEALAVTRRWEPTLTGGIEPERLEGQRVSHRYLDVLGVAPVLGRGFQAADDVVNGPRVVIISHGLWQRRFQSDPALAGREIRLNDTPYTVLGVMPPEFENVLAPGAEVWTPLQYDSSLPIDGREWGHHLELVGRLRAGIRVHDARRELQQVAGSPVPEFARVPWALLERGVLVVPLADDLAHDIRPALLAIMGAVVLLLVIAAVNVTGMLLARGARRQAEFSLRAVLGAGRYRLIRQVLAESFLVALGGGLLGLVLASAGLDALMTLAPSSLPRRDVISLDGGAFGFALGLLLIAGLGTGLIPALQASATAAAINRGTTRVTAPHHLARRVLVTAEVTLAVILLIGSGLLYRSLQRLFAVHPGFEAAGLMTLQVHTAGRRYQDDDAATNRFFAQALEMVETVPGVAAAAFTGQLPLSGDFHKYGVQFETDPGADGGEDAVFVYAVSPGYFQAMGIPLVSGRLLNDGDRTGQPVAVLLSRAYARRRFGERDPAGAQLHIGRTDLPWYSVVGVVGDVKQASLASDELDAVYVSSEQWYATDRVRSLVVRTTGDPSAVTTAIKQAVWSVDPDQPIARIVTMSDLVRASAAERRFAMVLLQAFAMAALVLAGVGIYGVMASSVNERMREIGVRSALGATRSGVVGLILRQGLLLTGLGLGIGLAAAAAATRSIESLMYGVSRLDWVTHGLVGGMVLLVALAASGVPAWRASRADPASVLRSE